MGTSDDPTWEYFQDPANRHRAMEGMTEERAAEILGMANPVGYIEVFTPTQTFSGDVPEEPLTVDQARELDALLTRFWANNMDDGDDRSLISLAVVLVRQHIRLATEENRP